MGKIFAVANQKGGVGKSTTVVNLAAALGGKGKKVLVIDFDPQGNSTTGYGIRKKSISNTIYEVVIGTCRIQDAIIKTAFKNISIITAAPKLAGAEVDLMDLDSRLQRLKMQVLTIKNEYDYILIDCPPSLGMLTLNALVCCDSILVPIQCEFYALEGLAQLNDTIKRVKENYNPTLEIGGIVFTMYTGRLNLTAQVVAEVKKYYENKVFNTAIPRNVALSEAPSFGKPIMYYDKASKGSIAYQKLCLEFLEREKQISKQLAGGGYDGKEE